MELSELDIFRFRGFINKTDSCWLWTSHKQGQYGYGGFTVRHRTYSAHRISWMIYKGEIPKGILVLHKCDVPMCVNPDHLYLGTCADNHRDMIQRKRARYHYAERSHCAKGHELSGSNVEMRSDAPTARRCVPCRREYMRMKMKQYRAAGRG